MNTIANDFATIRSISSLNIIRERAISQARVYAAHPLCFHILLSSPVYLTCGIKGWLLWIHNILVRRDILLRTFNRVEHNTEHKHFGVVRRAYNIITYEFAVWSFAESIGLFRGCLRVSPPSRFHCDSTPRSVGTRLLCSAPHWKFVKTTVAWLFSTAAITGQN